MEESQKNPVKYSKDILFIFFLVLVAGYLILPRIFTKINIRIGPVPLYITEIFLLLSVCLIIAVFAVNRFKIKKIDFFYYFLLLFLVFLLSLSIGLYSYRDITFVLRQSALIYYSIFYFVVFFLFDNPARIKYLVITLLVAGNIVACIFIVNFLGYSDALFGQLGSYIAGGFYFTLTIVFLLILNLIELSKRKWIKIILYADAVLLLVLSFIEYVRGNWVALFLATVFSLIISANKKKFLLNILIIILATVILATFAFMLSPKVFQDTLNELRSLKSMVLGSGGGIDYISSANTNWRMITWKAFIKESLHSPFFGWGFGRKFLPEETYSLGWTTGLAENWVSTHNYLISFLFLSGFTGLGIFLLLVISLFIKNIKFLRTYKNLRERFMVCAFLSVVFYILWLGLFGVVLEVPYQGVFLWIFLGLNMLIINRVESRYENTVST